MSNNSSFRKFVFAFSSLMLLTLALAIVYLSEPLDGDMFSAEISREPALTSNNDVSTNPPEVNTPLLTPSSSEVPSSSAPTTTKKKKRGVNIRRENITVADIIHQTLRDAETKKEAVPEAPVTQAEKEENHIEDQAPEADNLPKVKENQRRSPEKSVSITTSPTATKKTKKITKKKVIRRRKVPGTKIEKAEP